MTLMLKLKRKKHSKFIELDSREMSGPLISVYAENVYMILNELQYTLLILILNQDSPS